MDSEELHHQLRLIADDLFDIAQECERGEKVNHSELYALVDAVESVKSWIFWEGRNDKPKEYK